MNFIIFKSGHSTDSRKNQFLYIFEAEEKWIIPLTYTFKSYSHKVKIHKSLVGDGTSGSICLDNYFIDSNQIDIIKLDVEGAESNVIRGAANIINKFNKLIFLVCLYHYDRQENDVLNLLRGFKYKIRSGKMWFLSDKSSNYFSLRHGVAEFWR